MSWHKSKTKNTKQTSKLISNDFYIRHFFVALVARVSVMREYMFQWITVCAAKEWTIQHILTQLWFEMNAT